jgi:soluble methane monooxygenase-binding protein MmoD
MERYENDYIAGALDGPGGFDDIPRLEVHRRGRLTAFAQDLGFMWRWEIQKDGLTIQEGCSLSENSAREAVGHATAFLGRADAPSDDN